MELVQLVESYRRAFPWIFRALQQDGARRWTIEDLFPDLEPGEQSAKLQEVSWEGGDQILHHLELQYCLG